MTFKVAIVGRPNVGKSTLFNRLVGKRLALVDDEPGVTRDRRHGEANLGHLRFEAIDTAGLERSAAGTLTGRMRAQTEQAVATSDVCLFLIDARAGVTPADEEFAELVRRSGKPCVLVANKAEGRAAESGLLDAFRLGLGQPVPVSAEHGTGLSDLLDAIEEAAGPLAEDAPGEIEPLAPDSQSPEDAEARPVSIAVVGRPNVGKSTLVNRMIGDERLLVGPEAGITRDAIAIDWSWQGRKIRLIDTAGLRRRARVQEKLEKLSVADGIRAMQYAEVVVIVFDAMSAFEKQDLQIADLVIREGRAPVIALNKWDLVENPAAAMREATETARRHLPQVKGLRLVPVSGRTGEGIDRLMRAVLDVHSAWNRRVSTARLNRWLEAMLADHPPPAVSGRRIRIKYVTQIKTRPPTFVASCSRPEAMPDSYVRYLVNGLAEAFDLAATPIRLQLRKGENPYAARARKR